MAMVSRSFNVLKKTSNNNKGYIAAAKAIHKKYAPKVHEQAKKIRAAMAKLMALEDEISGEPTLQDVDCGITTAYASFDIHSDKKKDSVVGADDEEGVSFEAAIGMIEDVIRDSAPKEDGYDSSGDDDDDCEEEAEDEDEGGDEEEEEVIKIIDDE